MQLWRRILAIISALAAATPLMLPQSARAGDDAGAALTRYIDALVAEQDPRVADALGRIDGTGRRLLALRSYVRSRAHLADRWSWTSEQIAAYEGTPEHRDCSRRSSRVKRGLCAREPGLRVVGQPTGAQPRHPARALEHERIGSRGGRKPAGCGERGRRVADVSRRAAGARNEGAGVVSRIACARTDADDRRAGAFSPWPDARDRLPGAPGRARRRGSKDFDDRYRMGWRGLVREARRGRSFRKPAVRRAARFATGALALHVFARDCCGAIG